MLVIIPNQGSQPCIKHHPAATPMDSVLYPLRRTADHKWTMLALFSVVRTVTATVERAAGFISIHATHVGSDNCYTPRGGSRLAFAFAAFILLRCLCTQTSSFRSQRTPRTLPRTRHSMADI